MSATSPFYSSSAKHGRSALSRSSETLEGVNPEASLWRVKELKTYIRVPLIAAILFLFAGVNYAQRACPIPPPSPFRHNAQIVTRQDPKTKQWKVFMQHPKSLTSVGDPVYLAADFAFQDPRLKTKPTVDISFVSMSKTPRFEFSHALSLLIDGLPWPVAAPVQYSSQKQSGGVYLEITKVTLTYDSLVNLIQGKRVSAQLGMTKFELTSNHLEALREIANMMMPGNRIKPGGGLR
ncbi:MAG: hypothetical protein ICV60_02700 [Pyrinomonadaceae bacterium]|nr:hypothetical protein [Pyrinomonadaceae bacterium]